MDLRRHWRDPFLQNRVEWLYGMPGYLSLHLLYPSRRRLVSSHQFGFSERVDSLPMIYLAQSVKAKGVLAKSLDKALDLVH